MGQQWEKRNKEKINSDSGHIDDFVIKDQSMLRQNPEPNKYLTLTQRASVASKASTSAVFLFFLYSLGPITHLW
jgi:hypothetical protein